MRAICLYVTAAWNQILVRTNFLNTQVLLSDFGPLITMHRVSIGQYAAWKLIDVTSFDSISDVTDFPPYGMHEKLTI